MIFQLEDTNPSDQDALFFGSRKRFSTLTSVRFISPQRVACANFIQQQLYLIDFDSDSGDFEIVDSVNTKAHHRTTGKPMRSSTDLLDYDPEGQILAASHFTQKGVSYYEVDGQRSLRFVGWAPFRHFGELHGVTFCPGRRDLLALSSTHPDNPMAGTYIVDTHSGDTLAAIREPGWCSKDVGFLSGPDDDGELTLVNVFSAGAPKKQEQDDAYASMFALYRLTLGSNRVEKLDEIEFDGTHSDGCATHGSSVFITSETIADRGHVFVLDVENDKLTLRGSVGGFDFPHGIDLNHGLIALTEYGTCSLRIEPIADFTERIT